MAGGLYGEELRRSGCAIDLEGTRRCLDSLVNGGTSGGAAVPSLLGGKPRSFGASMQDPSYPRAGDECTPESNRPIRTGMPSHILQPKRALRIYNATPITQDLVFDTAVLAVAEGDADILTVVSKEDEQVTEVFDVPRPVQYSHETFYTMRHRRVTEVSFFAVLLESRDGFCILLVVMLVVWLAMCLRDYCYLEAFRINAVLDSGTFLVASFLANSTEMPMENSGNRAYRHGLSRVILLTAWMLAIFPLSVYFRGELTSRLAVAVPHAQIDTLQKLELALDKGDLQLCLVRDGCLSAVIAGTAPYRNDTLHAKLQKAFHSQPSGAGNMFSTVVECLGCANKAGFACFACDLQGCQAERAMEAFVESLEPLNLAFATTPTTKGYRLFRAYDHLLQRMFETALSPFNKKDRHCMNKRGLTWYTAPSDYYGQITQVFELSAFFATFACLMCVSLCVLCIEVALGS
ncbi:hypothetical protein HPB50_002418 [Hyalomma asiaticum]|uniref:Uncharacterized protein n=1 Tax=Hyalomma asiaticum TaxID=266040 RepID=A0ACB7SDX2_HYAAI|nr:hypothetical protein HPB50_002418 [Hyalomma asiaticum]